MGRIGATSASRSLAKRVRLAKCRQSPAAQRDKEGASSARGSGEYRKQLGGVPLASDPGVLVPDAHSQAGAPRGARAQECAEDHQLEPLPETDVLLADAVVRCEAGD